ncbi:MAG: phenylalanine--tRNA ligase subunit alpha, partial [Mizugakiibacter sp.]
MDALATRIDEALAAIAGADSLDALEAQRVALLGKSGFVTEQLKQLGALPPEQRKARGAEVNRARDRLVEAIAARRAALEEAAFAQRLACERLDVTLPGRRGERGGIHPVTRT